MHYLTFSLSSLFDECVIRLCEIFLRFTSVRNLYYSGIREGEVLNLMSNVTRRDLELVLSFSPCLRDVWARFKEYRIFFADHGARVWERGRFARTWENYMQS